MTETGSKSHIDTLLVLGGGLIPEGGKWRTSSFEEPNGLGDRLRVEATAQLYRNGGSTGTKTVIVSGGRGTLPEGAPVVADVLRKELIELGVSPSDIVEERESRNTYEQLLACVSLLPRGGRKHSLLISNRYHLPRIRAIVEYAPDLKQVKHRLKNGTLVLLSAESVLAGKKEWQVVIREAYKSEAMRERMLLEAKGVAEIQSGLYRYK